MTNSQKAKFATTSKLNGSHGKFQFLILPATKEISSVGWNLFIMSYLILVLFELIFLALYMPQSSFKGSVFEYVCIVALVLLITLPTLFALVSALYIIIFNKFAPQILLCEPSFLYLNDDFIQLDFTVAEVFGLTNFRRNGRRSRTQSLSSVDYDYVNYSYVIYKNEPKNVVVKNHLCTISGNSFLYIPKCFYEDTGIKIDPYHIAMHDKYLSDEDRKNRDSQYPWIIKKNKFSFVFAFKEKDAKQALLEWANKKVARP